MHLHQTLLGDLNDEKVDWSPQGGPPMNATMFPPSCLAALSQGSWIRTEKESVSGTRRSNTLLDCWSLRVLQSLTFGAVQEDCLYLSVWTPPGHIDRYHDGGPALPVLIYLHGM
jgi:hypothetical protein